MSGPRGSRTLLRGRVAATYDRMMRSTGRPPSAGEIARSMGASRQGVYIEMLRVGLKPGKRPNINPAHDRKLGAERKAWKSVGGAWPRQLGRLGPSTPGRRPGRPPKYSANISVLNPGGRVDHLLYCPNPSCQAEYSRLGYLPRDQRFCWRGCGERWLHPSPGEQPVRLPEGERNR